MRVFEIPTPPFSPLSRASITTCCVRCAVCADDASVRRVRGDIFPAREPRSQPEGRRRAITPKPAENTWCQDASEESVALFHRHRRRLRTKKKLLETTNAAASCSLISRTRSDLVRKNKPTHYCEFTAPVLRPTSPQTW